MKGDKLEKGHSPNEETDPSNIRDFQEKASTKVEKGPAGFHSPTIKHRDLETNKIATKAKSLTQTTS